MKHTLLPDNRGVLPMALAALGAGYYIFTQMQKPSGSDAHAVTEWQEHMSGARFALIFGASAGLVLWWVNREHEGPTVSRESLF